MFMMVLFTTKFYYICLESRSLFLVEVLNLKLFIVEG